MHTNHILLIIVSILLVGTLAIGLAWGRSDDFPAFADGVRPDLQETRVVHGALHMEDDLICAWNVVISEPLLDPATKEWRAVIVATLDYQLGVKHFAQTTLFRTVDPRSSEEITATLSIHPSSVDPDLEDRLIHVAVGPFPGTAWYQVESDEQVVVQPTLLERFPNSR